jgi:hypothetical protein
MAIGLIYILQKSMLDFLNWHNHNKVDWPMHISLRPTLNVTHYYLINFQELIVYLVPID